MNRPVFSLLSRQHETQSYIYSNDSVIYSLFLYCGYFETKKPFFTDLLREECLEKVLLFKNRYLFENLKTDFEFFLNRVHKSHKHCTFSSIIIILFYIPISFAKNIWKPLYFKILLTIHIQSISLFYTCFPIFSLHCSILQKMQQKLIFSSVKM